MTVFICGQEPDEIFSGIYQAWGSGLGHANVRLEPAGCNRELFCQYEEVVTNPEQAQKVARSIRNKLSEEVYELVYKAALSQDVLRADKIYRFLILAFANGSRIINQLQLPEVYEIFSMNRHLQREFDHMLGFTRFAQMEEGVLLAEIGPKNDITVLLARHFADRLSGENWILWDSPRKKAAVHEKDGRWVLIHTDSKEWEERLTHHTDQHMYEELWRSFYESIAIKERTNPRCQMNMLPLRFRPYMTEFQKPS